ncbi:SO_0444 family Cu/Zn efflux transporter [Halorhodospira halophila]|uniref:Permease n=1 Tax=Halorhodospira halophila (strain DSM 244 / SL1) TaxID=349124 RepID=A1WWT7_HALHL|nr:SO_0444 family Cu/Zn efflux transporter [Halorhodospira halophila]ABM62149.1 permease [Halorhodospira halophila SL1]MBK1729477.1 hypothetical protein [Halorhodospira halophila]
MIATAIEAGTNILDITVAVAPWLLIGLALGAVVQVLVPTDRLRQWLGGQGIGAVSRAAVIGAPLPLCSCGAIPTALSLHRNGASRGASTAFLVGTPGIGIDSVVLTWVLMGPFMAGSRVVGAVATAIATGLAVERVAPGPVGPASQRDGCCDAGCDGGAAAEESAAKGGPLRRMGRVMLELIDDIGTWVVIGLILAGLMLTFVPPGSLATWGSGLLAMAVLALVGIPLYICATAATPVAAAMLIAGVSPGAVLVFLIAGPVTSLATLLVLRRELGTAAVTAYLGSIVAAALAVGLLIDGVVSLGGLEPTAMVGAAREVWPDWIERTAAGVMLTLIFAPARRAVWRAAHWAWFVARGGRSARA